MRAIPADDRPYRLFLSIERGHEREWVPINQQERDVISHADIIRSLITNGRRKGMEESMRNAGLSMGMEILHFISHRHDDEDTACRIASLSGSYDNDMMTGILDDVYSKCINSHMPPEWVLPEMVNPVNDGPEHVFVINPKGLRI